MYEEYFDENIPVSKEKATNMNPQVLAFLGDGVHTLYVRTKVVENSSLKTGGLHRLTAKKCKAKSQAETIDRIFDNLTEEEKYIYKRGRNCKTASMPKNAEVKDYHKATGFEAVIGFLYITGDKERLKEILKLSEE